MVDYGEEKEVANDFKASLGIFVRSPRLGAVKTRLARDIGNEAAKELYIAMLRDVFLGAEQAQTDLRGRLEVCVFYTPEDALMGDEDSLNSLWEGAHQPQSAGDLGQKLFDCFRVLHEQGAQKIIVIGSDAPDLPPRLLVQALDQLEKHDAVFGPSEDGGFCLIGASCPVLSSWFRDVRWSSEHTLSDVLKNLSQKRVSLLPSWSDIDTLQDLQALQNRLQTGQSEALSTQQVMERLRLLF